MKEHDESSDCWCCPTIEYEWNWDGTVLTEIVIHKGNEPAKEGN